MTPRSDGAGCCDGGWAPLGLQTHALHPREEIGLEDVDDVVDEFLVLSRQVALVLPSVGIELEHLFVDAHSVWEPLHLEIVLGEQLEVLGRLRLQLASSQQPRQRLVVATLLLQDKAQVGMGLRQFGLEPDSFEVASAGLGELSQGAISITQIVMHLSQVGFQVNGLLAMGQGFLGAAKVDEELAKVGVDQGQIGTKLDSLAVVFQGLFGFTQRTQGVAQIGASLGIVGPQLDSGLEMLDSLLVSTEGAQGKSQVIVGIGKVRPELEGRLARANGPVELAKGSVGFREVGMIGGHAGAQGNGAID